MVAGIFGVPSRPMVAGIFGVTLVGKELRDLWLLGHLGLRYLWLLGYLKCLLASMYSNTIFLEWNQVPL